MSKYYEPPEFAVKSISRSTYISLLFQIVKFKIPVDSVVIEPKLKEGSTINTFGMIALPIKGKWMELLARIFIINLDFN